MDTAFGLRISGLFIIFALGPAFLVAQPSRDKQQVSVKRQILVLLSHEWMEPPSKITGTLGGAAFACAAVSRLGAYHLEHKVPSAVPSPDTYDGEIYDGRLSDADLKKLLALVDAADVKDYVGTSPANLSDTWQFVIARTDSFQRKWR